MGRERKMIVVDFDRHAFSYTDNKNDRKVGDRVLLSNGNWYLVYCLLDVDRDQDEVIGGLFCRKFTRWEKFCDTLNNAVEEILFAISDEPMEIYKKRKAEIQRRETMRSIATMEAVMKYLTDSHNSYRLTK